MNEKRTYMKTVSGITTVVRLTKAEAQRLAVEARQHGHQRLGFEEGAQVVAVRCPLCRDQVKGYYSPNGLAGPRTAAQALDRGMVEHLLEDCQPVSRST